MFDRGFALGLRRGLSKISAEENAFIISEIKRIEADAEVFVIDENGEQKTHYSQALDVIVVGANVFPDLKNPSCVTDKLTVACVLAHEYYGHRAMRDKYLSETSDSTNTALDEFNASFNAYKNTPNLTDDERKMLFEHAYEIARNGMLDKQIEMCRKIINEQFRHKENVDDDKENTKDTENTLKPYTR